MVLPAGMGDPVFIGSLFDARSTVFTSVSSPLPIIGYNGQRVALAFLVGGGLGGAAGFSFNPKSTLGVGVTSGAPFLLTFSQHSAWVQQAWYLVAGSNVSFEVWELLLREA